ncbi:MAG: hypothetical protein OEU76_06105 [Cyclobacteriaceae bacterium]|nr:hypothetical protein [Cyclobacteriaceae bacterium]
MKNWVTVLIVGSILVSCQENETVSEFTGNEVVYALQQASEYSISGKVIIKELKDSSAQVLIELDGTDGNLLLPAHLHLGDISTPGAEIAALLNPVNATTGKSETNLSLLADESRITYQELIKLEASIKVHLSDVGPERDIVLAGGNIGELAIKGSSSGRIGIGVCKSE